MCLRELTEGTSTLGLKHPMYVCTYIVVHGHPAALPYSIDIMFVCYYESIYC